MQWQVIDTITARCSSRIDSPRFVRRRCRYGVRRSAVKKRSGNRPITTSGLATSNFTGHICRARQHRRSRAGADRASDEPYAVIATRIARASHVSRYRQADGCGKKRYSSRTAETLLKPRGLTQVKCSIQMSRPTSHFARGMCLSGLYARYVTWYVTRTSWYLMRGSEYDKASIRSGH